MSFISHRCTCGHPDIYHSNNLHGPCSMHLCLCQGGRERGPSEVLPTKNNGLPVEQVAKPGTKPAGYTGITLCSCTSCVALYEELTGAPA